jgi:diguanylate cyclase (GGDEF)-like protein
MTVERLLMPILVLLMLVAYRAGRRSAAVGHHTQHDDLTGLPNRALFRDRVRQALAAAARDGTHVAVMLMDLDRFKEINDTLGHHHGDVLLRQVGPRLTSVLRAGDTVARLGGDEFGVLLPSLPDAHAADGVAAGLLEALKPPFSVHGLKLDVSASIGIACSPAHGQGIDALMRRADIAMYLAKAAQSGYETYSPAEDDYSPDRLAMLGDLRRAIEDGELTTAYMPKVDLQTGAVVGMEALVRWLHPQRGLIMPGAFVPYAEHTGLIKPMTMHVLDGALRECDRWRRAGLEIRVAVNLSVRSLLDRQLPDDVAGLLARWDVPPKLLELEITESTIMADPRRSREVLYRLSEMGIGLSVDDFGTGYSSLGYLKRLPVDELKVDRSFVAAMATDPQDRMIVESTIALARNLGLRIVAEGVETEEVRDELARLGCHLGQGYLFGPPIDGDAVLAALVAGESDGARSVLGVS